MNYKVILDKRRATSDNKYPLKLRLYESRSYKDKSLNIYIHDNEWDADKQMVLKNCSSHKLYNSKLIQEKADAEKQVLFGIEAPKPIKQKRTQSIIEYGSRLSTEFEKAGKTGNSIVYNTAVEMLLRYSKQKNILFEEIDYSFLNSFQNDLLRRKVGVNTISIYLRTIRAIFNKAINEEVTENYPFKKFKIRQQPTPSRTLTIEDVRKIANYECTGERQFNRDLFLLSFCLIKHALSKYKTLSSIFI